MKSVKYNAKALLEHLQDALNLVSGEKRDLMRMGREIMKDETVRAFRTQSDPESGSRWPARKGDYPWPMLYNTGTLFGSLDWGYGIKTRDRKLKLFGSVTDNTLFGGRWRSGKPKHPIVIAGAVHFGRSKRRNAKGTRLRARGGGFRAPSTGVVPPRPIFGFGGSAKAKFRRQAERRIGKVFD